MSEVIAIWELQEARWWSNLHKAIRNGTIQRLENWEALCPTCSNVMDFCERGERMTFAGKEPPCIQVQCNHCGFGGETTRHNHR